MKAIIATAVVENGVVWHTIPSYPKYQASKLGPIRNATTKRVLSTHTNGDGYSRLALRTTGKSKRRTCQVSWLVAEAFLIDWNPDTVHWTVDHINTISTDNRAINLRMATRTQQNMNQTKPKKKRGRQWAVEALDPVTKQVMHEFASVDDAAEKFNVNQTSISHALNGRSDVSVGYIWRYKTSTDLAGEIWARVGNSKLFVSNMGRVKRHTSNGAFGVSRSASELWVRGGYPCVKVGNVTHRVHSLVARAFLDMPNDPAQTVVNHINGNKMDPRVSNLEWCSQSENGLHAADIGLNKCRKPVEQIDPKTGKVVGWFQSITAAAASESMRHLKFASAKVAIGKVIAKKRPTSGGFGWRFAVGPRPL